ncbi:MAG: hypothetical protein WD336_08840 [Trueperaceae bacterium]
MILLPHIEDESVLPVEPVISTITLAELTVDPLPATSDDERAARLALLQQVDADSGPLPFGDAAARAFGAVAVSLQRSGHKRRARAFGASIAAIALAHDLPVYTANPDDFVGIGGLVVAPVPTA